MVDYDEIIQFVYYLSKPLEKSANQLWSDVFDLDLTGFQTIQPGHTQAQGQAGDNIVSLQVQAARVDCIINGKPTNDASGPAYIRDFEACAELGISAVARILHQANVSKTAVVLQGTCRSKSRDEAAHRIIQIVPGLPSINNGFDLQYQIVVPRSSRVVSTRRINQIFRITNVHMQLVQMQMPGIQGRESNIFATHAYVDVSPEAMENLDANQAIASMHECFDYARRVYKGGYNELA